MEILKTLLKTMPAEPVPIRKVLVGVHWTMVCSKHCGLGSTLVGTDPGGHKQVREVGELHKKSAQELAAWVLSDNLLEASIGIAALNSLTEVDDSNLKKVNASEVIANECRGKNLVIIGHFPFVEEMKTITRNCWVIEKRPYGDDFPEDKANEFIPSADMVAITGTAFINHTMEKLLSLCRPQSKVMVLGPSTPLLPVLFDYGISFLSGSRIANEEAAENTILQGATFPQVKGVSRVTMTNV